MAHYRHICLVEAPQAANTPFPRYISDSIGICYLASAVRDIAGSLSIPEHCHDGRIFDSLRSHLKQRPADLVAISSMTGGFDNALRLARIAKEHGACVVMGGFHPTACPEEALGHDCVDLVVIGEGEATFRELVEQGPSRNVKGLAWMENGELVLTEPRPLIDDVDAIAFPMRELRPERFGERGDGYGIDTIYTSRGCPWSCSFCANDRMHGRWRGRSPENVVEEIALLHDPKKKKLLKIWDANFLTSIKRAEAICDLMIERGLTNFRIVTETRARDIVRAERILGKLRRIGLRKVGLGIESPNPRTLELMNKGNSLAGVRHAIELLEQYGIGSEGYFIIGHHAETVADTMAYPGFAKSLGLRQALFMVMTPYPGTKVFDEYRAADGITSYDWGLYNNFSPVVRSSGMDTATLVRMLAYCTIAFSGWRSLLKRERTSAVLIILIKELLQVVFIMRVNTSLSVREITDAVFEAFCLLAGTERVIGRRAAGRSKRAPEPLSVGISHPSGRWIELRLEREGDERLLTIRTRPADHQPSVPVLSLEQLVGTAASISMDSLMGILYRSELARNNSGLSAMTLFGALAEPGLLPVARRLLRLFLDSLAASRANGTGGLRASMAVR